MTIQAKISEQIDAATGKFALFVIGLASIAAATTETTMVALASRRTRHAGAPGAIRRRTS